jgi:hypothetical protein
MDKYYTSVPLFHELSKIGIRGTGTVKSNRKYLHKPALIPKSEESKLEPGYTRFSSSGDLVLTSWFDKRSVATLSNAYQPVGDLFVEHWYTAQAGDPDANNGKVLKKVPIPPVVYNYRQQMGAVDTFDQYRSYVSLDMRTRKFWHPMMWFVFESAVVNAWVLYKASMKEAGKKLEYSHFSFRKSIALGLAAEWINQGACNRSADWSPTKEAKQKHFNSIRKSKLTEMEGSDRYTAPDKHVQYCSKIPIPENWKSGNRLLTCMHCQKCKTSQWCKLCRAPLCGVQCYVYFHTDPNMLEGAKK